MIGAHARPVHVVEAPDDGRTRAGAGGVDHRRLPQDLARRVGEAGRGHVGHGQRHVLGGGHRHRARRHAARVRLAGRGEEEHARLGREPVEEAHEGERVGADHPRGVGLDVAHADHGRQHVDGVPPRGQVPERVFAGEVGLDQGHARPRAERLDLSVPAAAREVVDEGEGVALGGETRGEVIADEPRSPQDQRPSHSRSPHSARPPRGRSPRRGCARRRRGRRAGAGAAGAGPGRAWRTRDGW